MLAKCHRLDVAIMKKFQAGPFADVANSNLGKRLWSFLNHKDSVIRMETATYLRRPALEGLEPQLLCEFGDGIRGDRWKQLLGRMARQVMEDSGYILDRSGVRISRGQLFTSAARYRRH
jgi:hypothetical protein